MRMLGSFPALAVWIALAGAAAAGPLSSEDRCGGDAFSSAQVVEGRPRARGPITAAPDTLCADLAPHHAPVTVDVLPYVAAPVGRIGPNVPYERGPYPPRR